MKKIVRIVLEELWCLIDTEGFLRATTTEKEREAMGIKLDD